MTTLLQALTEERVAQLQRAYDYAERLVPGCRGMSWGDLRQLGHRGRKADAVLGKVSNYLVAIEYATTEDELARALAGAAGMAFVPKHWRALVQVAALATETLNP